MNREISIREIKPREKVVSNMNFSGQTFHDQPLIKTLHLGITSNQNVSAYEAIQSMYKAKDLMYFKNSQQVLKLSSSKLSNLDCYRLTVM